MDSAKSPIFTDDQLRYLSDDGVMTKVKEYLDKRQSMLYNKIKVGQNATLEQLFEIRGRMLELDELKVIFKISAIKQKEDANDGQVNGN